jgi:ABC-type glycerol-3-phosphate transport system permease component
MYGSFSFTAQPYRDVLLQLGLAKYLMNTVVVGLACSASVLVTSALAAHALARMRLSGKRVLYVILVNCLLIPPDLVMLYNYSTMVRLHLYDSLVAVCLPNLVSIFGILILYRAFRETPVELYEAALLDGLSDIGYLWKIACPIARRPLILVLCLTFASSWNMLGWPILVTGDESSRVVAVSLLYLSNSGGNAPSVVLAGAIVTMAISLLFLVSFVLLGGWGDRLRSDGMVAISLEAFQRHRMSKGKYD